VELTLNIPVKYVYDSLTNTTTEHMNDDMMWSDVSVASLHQYNQVQEFQHYHYLPLTSWQLHTQNNARHSLSSAVLVLFLLTSTWTHGLMFGSRSNVVSRQHFLNPWLLGTLFGRLWTLNHISASPLYLAATIYQKHLVLQNIYYLYLYYKKASLIFACGHRYTEVDMDLRKNKITLCIILLIFFIVVLL
jgi:hypothetical protein